jgi:hypothetical protein
MADTTTGRGSQDGPRGADRTLAETNDPAALNGGPARHWFDGGAESLETPRRRVKVASAAAFWGVLCVGLVLLSGLI